MRFVAVSYRFVGFGDVDNLENVVLRRLCLQEMIYISIKKSMPDTCLVKLKTQ